MYNQQYHDLVWLKMMPTQNDHCGRNNGDWPSFFLGILFSNKPRSWIFWFEDVSNYIINYIFRPWRMSHMSHMLHGSKTHLDQDSSTLVDCIIGGFVDVPAGRTWKHQTISTDCSSSFSCGQVSCNIKCPRKLRFGIGFIHFGMGNFSSGELDYLNYYQIYRFIKQTADSLVVYCGVAPRCPFSQGDIQMFKCVRASEFCSWANASNPGPSNLFCKVSL